MPPSLPSPYQKKQNEQGPYLPDLITKYAEEFLSGETDDWNRSELRLYIECTLANIRRCNVTNHFKCFSAFAIVPHLQDASETASWGSESLDAISMLES